MSWKNTLKGAKSFAHMLSNGPRAARAEENERDQRDGESDEDYAKRMEELDEKERAEERKQRDGESDEDYAKRMEKLDDEDRKEEDAKRAASEGDDDGDDESDDAKKAARTVERARCARIMAHGIKIGAVRQAGILAFDTKISSKAAIATLTASQADGTPKRNSLSSRMAQTQLPNPGAASAAAMPSQAELIILAGKKRRGEV